MMIIDHCFTASDVVYITRALPDMRLTQGLFTIAMENPQDIKGQNQEFPGKKKLFA